MEALKKAVAELEKNLTTIMTEHEPRIKELEAAGKGAAEVKETVDKMSQANGELVDQVKEIQAALKQAEVDAAEFKEDVQKRIAARGAGADSAAFKTAGLHVAEAIAKDAAPFEKVKRGGGS